MKVPANIFFELFNLFINPFFISKNEIFFPLFTLCIALFCKVIKFVMFLLENSSCMFS